MGQFDQTIDDNGVNLTPAPQLDPLSAPNLGVPPAVLQGAMPPPPMGAPMARPVMPQAPQAPAQPGNMQHIISMALLGLAAGLGPRAGGGGVAQGLMQGQQANLDQRQQTFKDQQAQFKEQQAEVFRQQQIADREAQIAATAQQQREKNLQGALMSIQTAVKTLPDKATYDQRITGYTNLLRGSGYRIDENWLRQAVPYIAPSKKAQAQEAVAAFFKNPINAQQMKDNPSAFANGTIMFDANNDGVAELTPIRQLMDMAGMAVVGDEKGQPLTLVPSADGPMANLALKAKLNKFRVENRREPNPKEMDQLVTEARTTPKAPKDPGDGPMMQVTDVDPDTGEIVTSIVPKTPGEVSRKPPKEPNQAQFQAGAYAGRMEQSGAILDQLEQKVAGMHTLAFAAQQRLPPSVQTGDYQSYDQAGRNFVNALLRKESGAAISASEFDNARKQYLPLPGDTAQTLAQKKANRDYAFSTMKASAGRAYQAPITVPNADDAVMAARKKKP